MASIEYFAGDGHNLDLIQDLWEQLNAHHQVRSIHFQDHYARFSFLQRKAQLEKKAALGKLKLQLARETTGRRVVGYCIASLTNSREGEIESLFVAERHRKSGIGHALMLRALEWLEKNGAETKKITVACGNEAGFPFYAQYGFFPRSTLLEQKQFPK